MESQDTFSWVWLLTQQNGVSRESQYIYIAKYSRSLFSLLNSLPDMNKEQFAHCTVDKQQQE